MKQKKADEIGAVITKVTGSEARCINIQLEEIKEDCIVVCFVFSLSNLMTVDVHETAFSNGIATFKVWCEDKKIENDVMIGMIKEFIAGDNDNGESK